MTRKLMLFLLFVVLIPFSVSNALPVEITRTTSYPAQYARSDVGLSLRLIGGKGSVLLPGRNINLTFQTERDAYVVIYNIDSEGLVQLLYPADGVITKTRKGKVHFLPEKSKGIKWEVSGKTGIEYIHAVAVTDGDRINSNELKFLEKNGYQLRDEQLRVDMDPFLAFNLLDEDIIRDADTVPISTDYTYFYINREVDYPRYLCDKCHGDGNIEDPYAMECPEIYIEQMIYDEDDLYYPYPALYAVKHVDDADKAEEEDEYYSSTYYADNVTSDWDDEDYYDDSDSKVYLSVYYTNYDYPYRFNYPAYRSWYYTNYDPWYWDFGYSGFSFHWDNYYYHHWPFHSWYASNYYRYNWGCTYGYYNPWYYNSYYYPGGYHHWHHDYHNRDFYRNSRSIYANRSFTKRALNYTSSSVRTTRDRTLRDSRLGDTKLASRDARVAGKVRNDRGTYTRGSSPASGNSLVRRKPQVNSRRTPPSRVIYGGNSRTGTNKTRDINRPTSDKGSRTIDRGKTGTRSTGSSTRSRVWRSKRSTERESTTGRKSGTTERKSRTIDRSRSSERSSSERKTPERSTTRKSSSTRKSPPAEKSPPSRKNSSARKSSSSRKSPSTRSSSSSSSSSVRRSSSSRSTSSSSRSSSSSSRSSSSRSSGSSSRSSSSKGKRR
ncbi:MAG: DUF4384 domain-containing protein [Candidatus Krumholzibacteria bacterium]|nr:DUF4384 domain-containing protein [Candidatus Krumholzibacteria bacterium]